MNNIPNLLKLIKQQNSINQNGTTVATDIKKEEEKENSLGNLEEFPAIDTNALGSSIQALVSTFQKSDKPAALEPPTKPNTTTANGPSTSTTSNNSSSSSSSTITEKIALLENLNNQINTFQQVLEDLQNQKQTLIEQITGHVKSVLSGNAVSESSPLSLLDNLAVLTKKVSTTTTTTQQQPVMMMDVSGSESIAKLLNSEPLSVNSSSNSTTSPASLISVGQSASQQAQNVLNILTNSTANHNPNTQIQNPHQSPSTTATALQNIFNNQTNATVNLKSHGQSTSLPTSAGGGKMKRDERTLECTVPGCGKTFRRKSYLRNHMQIHNPHKAYGCDQCDSRYSQYAGLYMHYKQVHHQKMKKENVRMMKTVVEESKAVNELTADSLKAMMNFNNSPINSNGSHSPGPEIKSAPPTTSSLPFSPSLPKIEGFDHEKFSMDDKLSASEELKAMFNSVQGPESS